MPRHPDPNEAYTQYDVSIFDVEHVHVLFTTNDDGDTGYPGAWATDVHTFRGPAAVAQALNFTGKSRQGVGQRVYVTLDGKEY